MIPIEILRANYFGKNQCTKLQTSERKYEITHSCSSKATIKNEWFKKLDIN